MRSLWLASAASIILAGAAYAQTSPAPTGAPNAAPMTAPGQSPGNVGSSAPPNSMGAPSAAMDNSGSAPNNASGAPGSATVTAPGASSGKTMSAGPSAGSTGMASSKPMASSTTTMTVHHRYISGRTAMPGDATASAYLHIAKTSIMHHNKMMADEALSRAETRMLDRSVPQGGIMPDSSPAVSSVESARKALMAGDMKGASADTDMAMKQSSGM